MHIGRESDDTGFETTFYPVICPYGLFAHEIARALPHRDGPDELQRQPIGVVAHTCQAKCRIVGIHAQQTRIARLELLRLELLDRPGHGMPAQLVQGVQAEYRHVDVFDARKELAGYERPLDGEGNAVDAVEATDVEQVAIGGDTEEPSGDASRGSPADYA